MCLISRISTCRREKYLANTKTKTSFIKSTGWNEKSPKLNQLFGPPPKLSKRIRINKTRASSKNKKTKINEGKNKKNCEGYRNPDNLPVEKVPAAFCEREGFHRNQSAGHDRQDEKNQQPINSL